MIVETESEDLQDTKSSRDALGYNYEYMEDSI